jgi:hypothetical protein
MRRADTELASLGLELGKNALVFYQTRALWDAHDPDALHWTAATSRLGPHLGGQYVARISGTTSAAGGKISRGFDSRTSKGAGIRVYEYASKENVQRCRVQLEALFWLCADAVSTAVRAGMTMPDASARSTGALAAARAADLLDMTRLADLRIVSSSGVTVCPLCLSAMSAEAFVSRVVQAAGRETLDQTVTEVSLFHIQELRVGTLQHKPYNLGWGHHHCNVVTKDSGIAETLKWMRAVLKSNGVV